MENGQIESVSACFKCVVKATATFLCKNRLYFVLQLAHKKDGRYYCAHYIEADVSLSACLCPLHSKCVPPPQPLSALLTFIYVYLPRIASMLLAPPCESRCVASKYMQLQQEPFSCMCVAEIRNRDALSVWQRAGL